MPIKLIYQVHKWLALVLVVVTLGWFISGAVIAVPQRWRTLSPDFATGTAVEARFTDAPAFEAVRVPVASAIGAVHAQTGNPGRVTAVRLRRLPGRLAYEVSTQYGTNLVDAMSGEVFAVDEALAERVAGIALGASVRLGPVTRQKEKSSDYRGPIPAHRVPAEDGKGTVIYVSGTGDVAFSDRLSRFLNPIVRWHDFSVAFPLLPAPFLKLALFGPAVLGTMMTIAGALILLFQFRGWRRRRRVGFTAGPIGS